MIEDIEEWLKGHGATIKGSRPYRVVRSIPPSYFNEAAPADDYIQLRHEDRNVLQLEVPEEVVARWMRIETRMKNSLENHDVRASRQGEPQNFDTKNLYRHWKLLNENAMYKEAWMEFQSIRSLLGEDMWP